MPNTEVKLTNAESTWPEAAREDRKLLIDMKKDTQRSVLFSCVMMMFIRSPFRLIIFLFINSEN